MGFLTALVSWIGLGFVSSLQNPLDCSLNLVAIIRHSLVFFLPLSALHALVAPGWPSVVKQLTLSLGALGLKYSMLSCFGFQNKKNNPTVLS